MKVILLGAGGQLGTDIYQRAKTTNHQVSALRREDLDVSNLFSIEEAFQGQKFDVLINCTGYNKTDEAEDNPKAAININSHAVHSMARACGRANARFIHFSTDYVFGQPNIRAPISEISNPAPLNVYGSSKLLGESLVRATHENHLILRVASLFGQADEQSQRKNFVETILKKASDTGHLNVVNDQVMSPTSTQDLADWTIQLLDADPGTYHCVNSGTASWYEFAREIITFCGSTAELTQIESNNLNLRATRPAFSDLDNAKLASVLKYKPRDWRAALREYLNMKGHV